VSLLNDPYVQVMTKITHDYHLKAVIIPGQNSKKTQLRKILNSFVNADYTPFPLRVATFCSNNIRNPLRHAVEGHFMETSSDFSTLFSLEISKFEGFLDGLCCTVHAMLQLIPKVFNRPFHKCRWSSKSFQIDVSRGHGNIFYSE